MKYGYALLAVVAALLTGCGGGGSSPPITIALTAKADGVAITGFAVATGGTGNITIDSGQELQIDSSTPVSWTTALNSTILSAGHAATTSTAWMNKVSSPTDTIVTITVTSTTDATKTASVIVTVKAQRYAISPVKAGDFYAFDITSTTVGNSTTTTSFKRAIQSVNANGTYVFHQFDASNAQTFTYTASKDGNVQTYQSTTPGSLLCTYIPVQPMYQSSMYVGLTSSSTYSLSCGGGLYAENLARSSTIVGYEAITVPAGTFNTLKTVANTTVSNSTDANVNGMVITDTCWMNVVTSKNVKCTRTNVYVGTPPVSYVKSYTTALTSYLKQ